MHLTVFGLNHKSAPVNIRESVAYEGDALHMALRSMCDLDNIDESVIVSTCNRSEFYCWSNSQPIGVADISDWLNQQVPEQALSIDQHGYHYQGKHAVSHLFRVACGLDSLVLGETQILGQLKSAYQTAKEQQTAGSHLSRLFEQAFSVAKLVRKETAIGTNPISVAYAAVRLAQQIFGELSHSTALLIGAGETIELTARHIFRHGIGNIIIANRSVDKATKLAQQFNGTGVGIPDIPQALLKADIIISSTASPLPLLGKGTVESVLKARKHKPFFMVDIAVPRDIEPEVGKLDDVYLYTVDDLASVIEESHRSRQAAAEDAEQIICMKIAEFEERRRSMDANATITRLRQRIDLYNREATQKALRALEQGKPPEEALKLLSHTLCNKLLHQPSVELRRAAAEGDATLMNAAEKLFKLKD